MDHRASTQRQKIIDYLQKHPQGANTLELVRNLDILRPAARISELRRLGYDIISHRRKISGHHGVAFYILLSH